MCAGQAREKGSSTGDICKQMLSVFKKKHDMLWWKLQGLGLQKDPNTICHKGNTGQAV